LTDFTAGLQITGPTGGRTPKKKLGEFLGGKISWKQGPQKIAGWEGPYLKAPHNRENPRKPGRLKKPRGNKKAKGFRAV